VYWNPLSLVAECAPEDPSDYSDDEDDELDDCFVSVRQTEDEWFVYCQKTWSVLPFSTSNFLLDALIFWLNYCTLSTSVLCSWQKYGA
jgi:hypothetical protein